MATIAATHLPTQVATAPPTRFYARMASACVTVAFVGFALRSEAENRGATAP